MNPSKPLLAFSAALLVATAGTALAKTPHARLVAHHGFHHRFVNVRYGNYYGVPRYESAFPYYQNSYQPAPLPYVPSEYDYSPGAIVARATIRSQLAPGLATEFAPDAPQTATGGPVGGFPNQSGGGR